MIIVLDTNVVVSGFLNAYGAPGEIVRLVAAGKICLAYDVRILDEYVQVLSRPKFKIDHESIAAFIDQVRSDGILTTAMPLSIALKDPSDKMFLEVAAAANVPYLVTGNMKHWKRICGMSSRGEGLENIAATAKMANGRSLLK